MRIHTEREWYDIETQSTVTETQLLAEFLNLQAEDTDGECGHRDITFGQYLHNCMTAAGGTLEPVHKTEGF